MVFVTGYGVISAMGKNVSENLANILAQKNVLAPPSRLKTSHRHFVGEVSHSDEALRQALQITDLSVNRTTLLGLWALREALEGLPLHLRKRAAFINATTVGGMDAVEQYYARMISPEETLDTESYLHALDASYCTRKMASLAGIKGFQTTISTACSSAANALRFGAKMIEEGLTDIAICGGTDALSRFTLNGFISLKNVAELPSMPFDNQRTGLNLGEGAAYLILESERSVEERNVIPKAILAGYGNTNEAHHPTAPAPGGAGAIRTMKKALQKAGIEPDAIDFIAAHGTATQGNDLSEGLAIQKLFGIQNHPPFASLKSYTGHTLAASGAIEAIMSCLMLNHDFWPASLRFETQMKELDIQPLAKTIQQKATSFVLNNSFGFGGNDVSLIFKHATNK